MSCKDFVADFFNDVAAIAVVLMLTKVVMHRSRQGTGARRCMAVVHVATVLAAGSAIAISLWAIDACKLDHGFHWAAWILLGFTVIGLLADIIVEDLGSAWRWSIAKASPADTDS